MVSDAMIWVRLASPKKSRLVSSSLRSGAAWRTAIAQMNNAQAQSDHSVIWAHLLQRGRLCGAEHMPAKYGALLKKL